MAFTQSNAIEVKRVKGKGRGVFARRLIRQGEMIERVPMLILTAEEFEDRLAGTSLANYCFAWSRGTMALALDSFRPNARYDDVGPQTKEFTAMRDIAPGEEITVNYNGERGTVAAQASHDNLADRALIARSRTWPQGRRSGPILASHSSLAPAGSRLATTRHARSTRSNPARPPPRLPPARPRLDRRYSAADACP